MKRRQFIALIGAAATAWPRAVCAQRSAVRVIGFLSSTSPESYGPMVAAFRKGLSEAGYVKGRNVTIEYRWAQDQNDRLPALAADLVRRRVAVIAATTAPAALSAKAVTTTIPIVFEMSSDPVEVGLVASLNRPGGNATGVTQLNVELAPKRLELLHELVPVATTIALLVNPSNPVVAERNTKDLQAAASTYGLQLRVLHASTERDFDTVFATLVQLRGGGLVIGSDAFFANRRKQLGDLTARHLVPAIHANRDFAAAGGLMSYGTDLADAYRLVGVYAGRILNGEQAADLPVQRSTKVELVMNMKTAKTLGLTVPIPLLGRADEVIE